MLFCDLATPLKGGACFCCWPVALLLVQATQTLGAPVALNPNLQLRLLLNTTNASGSASIRIVKDPLTNDLFYSKFNGDIYRVTVRPGTGTSTSTKLYDAANHGIADSAQGMAIGPDGTIYLVGNFTTNGGNSTFARIVKGVPGSTGERVWSILAQTEAYPRSRTAFDHVFNGIIASPDGNWIFINSGSRTDHGEVQDVGGLFPDTREVALTAKIFRLPANASNLLLPNDDNALRSAGYIFAEGTRNSFDFAFAPNGDLFATENGPDRDMSDELNWLRQGLHFGFPWRIGGADNPQQFPDYDPANDLLLDPRFVGVGGGYYHNDPSFPPRPANLLEPVVNVGPDADKFRDPATGQIKDASELGQTLSTFTAHRSPLGLVFDTAGAMDLPFRNHGFMLSFTRGDPNGNSVPGPFFDASQDLVDLELSKLGDTNYQARVTKLVGGFSTPIDAEIIANRIYVLEYSGNQGLWEITFPPAHVTLTNPMFQSSTFKFTISGAIPGLEYQIQASTNLMSWTSLTNVVATNNTVQFTDTTANSTRFYRALQL
jgi:hypothetical protein